MNRSPRTHPYNLLVALAGWIVVVYQVSGLLAAAVTFLSALLLQALLIGATDVQSRFRAFVRTLQFSLPLMLVYTLIQAAVSSGQSVAGNTGSTAADATGLARVLWAGPSVPTLGHLMITTGSLFAGIDRALRLWSLLLGIMAITRMIRPDDVTVWLGRHFARVGLTISMMMNFLPLLQAEYRRIHEYVWSRAGISSATKRSVRIRATGAVLQALLMNALERSWLLAESMFVRGYGNRTRSFYQQTAWSTRDVWMLLAWVVLAGAAFLLNLPTPGVGALTRTTVVTPLTAQLGFSVDVCLASLTCLWMGGVFRCQS